MILTINAFPFGKFCMGINKELNVYIGSFPKQNNSLGGKKTLPSRNQEFLRAL